jgi:sulfur carrier protein
MQRGNEVFNMQIQLNGEAKNISEQTTVADLLALLELAGRRIAVELNQDIVPKSQHGQVYLQAGDVVEIVHAIGGG